MLEAIRKKLTLKKDFEPDHQVQVMFHGYQYNPEEPNELVIDVPTNEEEYQAMLVLLSLQCQGGNILENFTYDEFVNIISESHQYWLISEQAEDDSLVIESIADVTKFGDGDVVTLKTPKKYDTMNIYVNNGTITFWLGYW